MDDIIFYESLKIAEWKKNNFQRIYDKKINDLFKEFIIYVEKNKYGEIDIKNKSISITYRDGTNTSD
jgi:hypothetical protein